MINIERSDFYKQILKPGCKVLLYDKRGDGWNTDGEMDIYKGKVVEVKKVEPYYFNIFQSCYDTQNEWAFGYSDIQEIVYMPIEIGDIVTSRNRYLEYLDKIQFQVAAEKQVIQKYDKNSIEIIKEQDADKIFSRLDFIGKVEHKFSGGYVVKAIKDRTHASRTEFLLDENAVIKLNFDKNYDKIKINEEEGKTMELTNQVCTGIGTVGTYRFNAYATDITRQATKDCATASSYSPIKKIPGIRDYKVYNNKTVVVNFSDGTKTHVTCTDNDIFDIEVGIEKCILKKVCGENFKNQIQAVKRAQEKREKLEVERQKAAKEAKEAREKRYLKCQDRKFKRRVKKEAEFQVALQLKKDEIIEKLKLTDSQKKVLNEELSK